MALEVITHIFTFMPIANLMEFASMCRTHRIWVLQYINQRKDNHLAKFVTSPTYLLHAMRITSSVISGSFALAMLLPAADVAWGVADLDIYTNFKSYHRLIIYLLREGYTIRSTTRRHSPVCYSNSAIRKVMTLDKQTRSIDVIISAFKDSTIPIFHFHSTIVMNYVSADSLFSAYPRLTSQYRALVNPLSLPQSHVNGPSCAMEKYRHRGFRIPTWSERNTPGDPHTCENNMSCPRQIRATHDRGSLRLELDIANVTDTADNEGNKVVLWRFGGERCVDGNQEDIYMEPYIIHEDM
ncbi:hypothetical protein BJ138DRAFT_1117666 [Hygrophoropsis aurantiaca]|uniref:Uncharacterized protein n=1 Tax=Hygrophoropsis aurantiaca TaxID=72124 RepID=A0ACB7ZZF9_9AGAM|nr:hypothetical protein BJ138DRAFT_1117666 [Hygrophoropsis aurantiaca]